MQIRRAANLTSIAKYAAITEGAYNGRIYNFMWYHKAITGRFASTGFQLHNLPRTSLSEPDTTKAIKIIHSKAKPLTKLKRLREIDSIGNVFKALIRACVLPDSKKFVIADYSSIEFVIMLWFVADRAALKKFKNNTDFYKIMGARIFNCSIDDVDKHKRLLGKLAMLGGQYGMSAKRFALTCRANGLDVSDTLAKKVIKEYRAEFSAIANFWQEGFDVLLRAMQSERVELGFGFEAKYTGPFSYKITERTHYVLSQCYAH